MPRKNPEQERRSAAELLVVLLQERLRRIAQDALDHANKRHIKQLCSTLLWKHSEAFGKYDGCRHWSHGALESRRKHRKPVTNKVRHGSDALRHEHLFPRRQLVKKLFSLQDPSVLEVRAILDRLNIGVVVTVAEDERLPGEGVEADPWDRYRTASIRWTADGCDDDPEKAA